jgi:hypothetical protein
VLEKGKFYIVTLPVLYGVAGVGRCGLPENMENIDIVVKF